jgi:hypothetical protein
MLLRSSTPSFSVAKVSVSLKTVSDRTSIIAHVLHFAMGASRANRAAGFFWLINASQYFQFEIADVQGING